MKLNKSSRLPATLFFLITLISILTLFSCIDESFPTDNSQSSSDSNPTELSLPGYLAVKLNTIGGFATRDISYDDGEAPEYTFAPREENGTYHNFFVAFNSKGENLGVFPMDLPNSGDQWNLEGPTNDNITLTVSSIISSGNIPTDQDISTIDGLVKYLNGANAYFLININEENIVFADKTTKLATCSESQLKKAILSNYSIKVKSKVKESGTDGNETEKEVDIEYFTMTNSTYIDGKTLKCSSPISITSDKIFPTVQEALEAKDKTVCTGYLERVAVKYTVNFDNLLGDDNILTKEIPVKIFDGSQGTNGVEYTENGYIIHSQEATATIKIIGVAVGGLEKNTNVFKNIQSNTDYFTGWNTSPTQSNDYRCFWAEDANYLLVKNEGSSKSPKGYPHQFRQALETDSILSLHIGGDNAYDGFYKNNNDVTRVGTIKTGDSYLNPDCVLEYIRFEDITGNINEEAFYSLENTYYDPGMNKATWVWPWEKAPYSTATHLIVAAQIQKLNNTNIGTYMVRTLYNGQNNIFYYDKNDLLKSKLEIFNNILLSGGNSGIRVLHALFDLHKPYNEGNFPGESENVTNDEVNQNLYKLAWNNDSKLWFAQKNEEGEYNGEDGNKWNIWEANAEGESSNIDLIPAEISGGDGQMLIAPAESYTGPDYKYFLAPRKKLENGEFEMTDDGRYKIDWANKVEINYHHLVALFHKIIGPIDVYTDGYMYYAIPIPHNINNYPDDAWKLLGKIGVIRNNWYNLTVKAIDEIGTPVHDVSQPIVPVMDVKRSYINLGVKLLQWHEVIQTNVPMQ